MLNYMVSWSAYYGHSANRCFNNMQEAEQFAATLQYKSASLLWYIPHYSGISTMHYVCNL